MRNLVWFSCGAASAVASKIAVQKYDNVEVLYCDTGSEHKDNMRFLKDVEKWIDTPIKILKNEKYKDHWDVINKTKFLSSRFGARCTIELKKKLRLQYQKFEDVNIIGYTMEEKHRAKRICESDEFTKFRFLLIENGISKKDCLGIIWKSGIKLPAMYEMGYNHNNCIGCVKGGKGYWNKIRKDFPGEFNRMAKIERELGRTVIMENDNNLYLDEMRSDVGNYAEEKSIECGIHCELAYQEMNEQGSE